MFADLQSEFDNYLDLPEARIEELQLEINRRGKTDKVGLKTYLNQIGYGIDTPRSLVYEAIWDNPKGWEDFIYDELVELVAALERGKTDAEDNAGDIMYLTMFEGNDVSSEFYKKTADFAFEKLASPHAEVREYCAEAILDYVHAGHLQLDTLQKQKLQQLLQDNVLQVRLSAYSQLKEMKLLPPSFKLSWWDRLRAKLTGKGYLLK